MKHIILFISLILIFAACKEKKEQLKLPVENLYILEVQPYRYEDSRKLVEIDSLFNAKITVRKDKLSPYYTKTIHTPDSIKTNLLKLIYSYKTDTLFYKERPIHDNPIYFFAIVRKPNKITHIWVIKPDPPNDLQKIQNYFFNSTILETITEKPLYQDSIQQAMDELDFFVFSPPPFPQKIENIKFEPPIILE